MYTFPFEFQALIPPMAFLLAVDTLVDAYGASPPLFRVLLLWPPQPASKNMVACFVFLSSWAL